MEYSVEVNNLSAKYGRFLLDNINFKIEKGTIMGLIGENGAGKTTTIKALLNIIERDSGEIKIFNKDLGINEINIKEDIAVVPAEGGFYEKLSVGKTRKIMKAIYKNWNDEDFYKYLKILNIPEKKKIRELSTGMKKKLYIALALSHKPKLLILDEPTASLDPVAREEILDLLLDFIQEEENSILISSHITTDLEKIADNVTFIKDGKIVFSEEKDNLIYSMGIARCDKEDFERVDRKDYLFYRGNTYSYDLLVKNKIAFKEKYENIIVDNADIDSIMIFYVRGKK